MREREYDFEALAEVTGTDWTAGRGELNAALKSIREQSGIEDGYLLADEIHVRAKLYREVMPDVMLTPTALAKHWLRVFEETEQRKAQRPTTNAHAPATTCRTCDGDRFVVAGLRAIAGMDVAQVHHEEWACCPDCNTADVAFWRHDGSRFTPPDPARVREMMSQ